MVAVGFIKIACVFLNWGDILESKSEHWHLAVVKVVVFFLLEIQINMVLKGPGVEHFKGIYCHEMEFKNMYVFSSIKTQK